MAAWREQLDLFALALRRATVLELPAAAEADAETLHASDAHLPGAGWIVGIAAGLSFALLGLLLRSSPWGAAVAALAATTVAVALTRGSGETALYRTAERLHAPGAAGRSGSGRGRSSALPRRVSADASIRRPRSRSSPRRRIAAAPTMRAAPPTSRWSSCASISSS